MVHSMRQSTEWSNFMLFYVNMWITDPEVDSRLSGHVLWPFISDSHLYGVRCSPLECMLVRQRIHAQPSDSGGSGVDATLAVACASWFACYVAPRVCALFLFGRSMKLGIMAGMPRKTAMCVWVVACTRLVLLVTVHPELFSIPWFAGL